MRVLSRGCLAATLLALVFVSGCGPTHGRVSLSGTVTFKGQPLDTGHVTFLKNTTPPTAVGGALIRDGKFSVPDEQGLEPGTYKVAVRSPKGQGKRTPEQIAAGASTPAQEQIPVQYNDQTTLTIEVTRGGPNQFELKLE